MELFKFTIRRCRTPLPESEAREAYPRAQTCFNTLILPGYETLLESERRIRAVIAEGAVGFDEGAAAG